MPKKVYTGTVISNRMDKTVVVGITRLVQHKRYKKTIKKLTKLKAHDAGNACGVGDQVSISEARPISKDKRWVVLEIVKKA